MMLVHVVCFRNRAIEVRPCQLISSITPRYPIFISLVTPLVVLFDTAVVALLVTRLKLPGRSLKHIQSSKERRTRHCARRAS